MAQTRVSGQLSARIAYLDKKIPSLQKQLEELLAERQASVAYLPFANALSESASEPEDEPPPVATKGKAAKSRREPPVGSNLGQAIAFIRTCTLGATIDEIMAWGTQNKIPFLRQSLVTQLRKLAKKRFLITRAGDRYVALKQ